MRITLPLALALAILLPRPAIAQGMEDMEGVIWFEDYDSGVAGTNEAQVDISSTEEHTLIFLENTWESDATGSPDQQLTMWDAAPCARVGSGVTLASFDAGSARVLGDYALASAMGWSWGDWGKCTIIGGTAGCAGVAAACAFSGPGWAGCTSAWCAGGFIGAALGCAGAQM